MRILKRLCCIFRGHDLKATFVGSHVVVGCVRCELLTMVDGWTCR